MGWRSMGEGRAEKGGAPAPRSGAGASVGPGSVEPVPEVVVPGAARGATRGPGVVAADVALVGLARRPLRAVVVAQVLHRAVRRGAVEVDARGAEPRAAERAIGNSGRDEVRRWVRHRAPPDVLGLVEETRVDQGLQRDVAVVELRVRRSDGRRGTVLGAAVIAAQGAAAGIATREARAARGVVHAAHIGVAAHSLERAVPN